VLVQDGSRRSPASSTSTASSSAAAPTWPLVSVLLRNSNRLHHPAYIGHQVAVPMAGAAIADLVNGSTNNSMPVYEMGPAGSAVERKLIDWALSKVGWQAEGSGVMTHGGSMSNLTCLLAARAAALPEAWERGVPPGCCILVPESSHYSNGKAAAIMGLGMAGAIKIPVDAQFRVPLPSLAKTYEEAVRSGRKVLAVVANACATATGSYATEGNRVVLPDRACGRTWTGARRGARSHQEVPALLRRHRARRLDDLGHAQDDGHLGLCGWRCSSAGRPCSRPSPRRRRTSSTASRSRAEVISVNTLECTKSMLST
jgi:hypothetical protein